MSDLREYEALVRWTHPDGYREHENIIVQARNLSEAELRVLDTLRKDYQPGGKIVLLEKHQPRFTIFSI